MLGNFLFKIITKVTSDKLSIIASQIVSPNQFGYVRGHQIKDCIAIASDCVNMLDKHGYGSNMVLKLDIHKHLINLAGLS